MTIGFWGGLGLLVLSFLLLTLCVFVGMWVIGGAGRGANKLRGEKRRKSILFSRRR